MRKKSSELAKERPKYLEPKINLRIATQASAVKKILTKLYL
jgi:hypothetical protein